MPSEGRRQALGRIMTVRPILSTVVGWLLFTDVTKQGSYVPTILPNFRTIPGCLPVEAWHSCCTHGFRLRTAHRQAGWLHPQVLQDRLIKGPCTAWELLVLFFLVVSLSEYFGKFGTSVRTALFWSLAAVTAVVLVRFIAIPLVKLFHLGTAITHAEAARIVGNHFPQVKDKLLNTLQLRGQSDEDPQRRMLIEASIAQRSRELSPVPFSTAIDLGLNRRYLRYALPPVGYCSSCSSPHPA